MNFVTKAVFLAMKNISSLIFVTKNIFCCSGKGHEHSAFEWDERGIAVKALMDEDYA